MRKKTTTRIGETLCITLCLGLFPAIVAAASLNELSLSALAGGANYVAEEYRYGTLFNREAGRLSGPSLRGRYANGLWRVGIEYRNLLGTIAYQGQNQLGIPIASQTDLNYSQFGISATYRLGDTPLYTGIKIRSRSIDRRIHATPITQPLHETLRQLEWGPIVGIKWKPSEKFFAVMQATVLATQRSVLSVDFLGSYDSGELTLPRNSSHDILLSLQHNISPSFALIAEIGDQRFTPARSSFSPLTINGMPVGIYNYPGSTQNVLTFCVGVRMRW